MADKVTKITWQVNAKQLEKLMKTQAAYRKETQAIIDQTKLLASAGQQLDQSYQKQAQTVQRAASEIDAFRGATQQAAQANYDASNAAIAQANAQGQANQANEEAQVKIRSINNELKTQTQALNTNNSAWLKGAKTLAFYAIGAASVFRLVQKMKREFADTVGVLTQNTEAADRLAVAQDRVKIAFVGALGSTDDWIKAINLAADAINLFADGVIQTAAIVKANGAVIIRTFNDMYLMVTALAKANELVKVGQFVNAARLMKAALEETTTVGEGMGVWLDAYNTSIEESTRAQKEFLTIVDETGKAKDEIEKLSDEQKKYNDLLEKLVKAEEARIEALLDAFEEYERGLQDIALETQRAFEDLALTGARKREDIEIEYQRKLENLQNKAREAQRRAEEALRLKLLRIELRFRERMIRIQEDFEDSIYSAIQKRDATAALMAIRNRAREEGRAKRERANAIELARAEYKSRINEQNAALRQMREDAELWRKRQLEDLRRDLERERQDILLNQQRERDDLELWLARRLQDIEDDYVDQTTKARDFYTGDETEYGDHLTNKLDMLQDYYEEIARIHSMNAGLLVSPDVPTGGVVLPGSGVPPGLITAAQGLDQTFTQPTNIRVADAGRPERVVAQPITPGVGGGGTFSGTMSHQISGSVSAAMAGFEGRIGAIVTREVINAMADMLQ